MKQQISKLVLAERLGRMINARITVDNIGTLIFGWTRKNPELRTAINHRHWLYDYEVQEFSKYAGYDLLQQG